MAGRREGAKRCLIGVIVIAPLLVSACSDSGSKSSASKCDFEGKGRCRPDSERIDLVQPSFSNPTAVTNPLFPARQLAQVVQLGRDGNTDSRVEITPLPATRTIDWNGKKIETLVTQFLSLNNRRIVEVANDYVAQADDGSVWYFGEKVSNYKNGAVKDGEGSWLAGKDGPPGLLMPAHPKAGNVFRPENIPGLVFEEDTVTATDQTVDGPRGPISGAVTIREHLRENSFEDKTNAPGYGELRIRAEDETADIAVAVPTDAAAPPPEGIHENLQRTLDSLTNASGSRDDRQRVLDSALTSSDVELRYLPVPRVDVDRMDVWVAQALLDDGNKDAWRSDVASLETIRDRVVGALDAGGVSRLDAALRQLRAAVEGRDPSVVADPAHRLRDVLRGLTFRD